MNTYTVTFADRGGPFSEFTGSLDDVLRRISVMYRLYPRGVACHVVNDDKCDYNTSGLSEEEQEAIEAVCTEARL